MRRVLTALLTAAALCCGSVVAAAPASATAPVTIKKIANVKVAYGKKATIRPQVTTHGSTAVSSQLLTVKAGKKTVAKNVTSAKLKAGTYTVTTTVKYRTYKKVTTTTTVTKKTVGVPVGVWTDVRCTPSRVVADTSGTTIDAACTGAAFDGSVRVTGLRLYDGWGMDGSFNELETSASPVVGKAFAARLSPGEDLVKSTKVKEKRTTTKYSAYKKATKTQKLTVTQGKRPSRTSATSSGECPSWAPIKGNADSMIFHVPGGRWYKATVAEECFSSVAAAKKAGYRASKNG
jgi:hypothetical protein